MKRRKISYFLAISSVLSCLFSIQVQAATLDVGPSGYPYSTIQDAIDAANNGDTVLVHDGTYIESITFSGKAITVRSENGPESTIIDSNESGSVVVFNSGEGRNSVLDGFTIQNGLAHLGGGIHCSGTSPTITNCTISENKTDSGGKGGGIYCVSSSSTPTISNCTILGNQARGTNGGGGGIYCGLYSHPNIDSCTITGNTAAKAGGGIDCYASRADITNCLISGNTASGLGGGIHCYNRSPNISNCIITGNTVTGTTAGTGGGGLSCFQCSPILTNCTISANTGNSCGGAILCLDALATVVNSILWGNSDAGGDPDEICLVGSSIDITYSDIEGGYTGDGNIDNDPEFADAANGDFHLMSGSPCINSGTTSGAPEYDFEGDPRLSSVGGDDLPDMGADEFVNTPTGTNVEVDAGSGITVTFDEVTGAGNTTATETTCSAAAPSGFRILPLDDPTCYDVETTATYSGTIEVCMIYDDTGLTDEDESNLKLWLYEDPPGEWVDITTSIETVNNIICGETDSLSQFAVMLQEVAMYYEDIAELLSAGTTRGTAAKGNYAYALTREGNLNTFDVSDILNLSSFETYEPIGSPLMIGKGGGLLTCQDYLYAYESGITVLNIQNPASPSIVSSIGTLGTAYNMIRSGSYLIACEKNYVEVFSVTTPSVPLKVGELFIETEVSSAAVCGNHLYVAGGWSTPMLYVIDFSDPADLSLLNSMPLDNLPYHMKVVDNKLITSCSSSAQLWSLSDPLNPFGLDSVSVSGRVCAQEAGNLFFNGTVLSVDNSSFNMMQTFDIHGGGQYDGFPYGSDLTCIGNRSIIFLAQSQRVFVLRSVVPLLCKSDFDYDGDVDGSDLAVFAAAYATKKLDIADLNDDGYVDESDLAVFATEFGRTDCALPGVDYWVNASKGSDSNSGTQDEPFKTISHALSAAGENKVIKVLPGTYDEGVGETFPLVLQAGQVLVGDENNKGDGATPTLIVGQGGFDAGSFDYATIVGAEGSRVSGFKIGAETYTMSHFAIVVDGITMQISDNTFKASTYGGVLLRNNGSSLVERNVFDTNSYYGVYIWHCPDGPTIRNNTFLSMSIPMDVVGSSTYALISGNTITGNGQCGIQVQHGHPLIENNTFNQSSGYTYGAIRCYSTQAEPTVRGNVFICNTAVRIDDGNPDLGTASETGNNDFSSVSGVSLTHGGSATVYAIGNTWPNTPPEEGTDIVVSGTGSVVWGTGPDDHYP